MPNSEYTFTGWFGDLSGDTNPTSNTMNGSKTVVANYQMLRWLKLPLLWTSWSRPLPNRYYNVKILIPNHLKGYLQWNIFSSRGAGLNEGDQFILRISIIDKAGNESRAMIFPMTFMSGVKGQANLPVPFDQRDIPRLGHMSIDLISQWWGGKKT